MKRYALPIVAVLALFAAAGLWMAPPAGRTLTARADLPPILRGAIHVHTRRSDGTGTVEEVAEAAARAGLAFVILTDHGDAARRPDSPAYRHGVLCIDAVEISTDGGHVVALGLMDAAPYPLGGEPRDVVADIARLGGMSIAAHPGSVNVGLRWADWTLPLDGLEWLNGDSEWRDESAWTLARTLLTYPFRQTETLGALLDRPDPVIARWDALSAVRRVVAVAGADAHARIWSPEYGGRSGPTVLHVPSYEQMFRSFSLGLPEVSLSDDPVRDAATVITAIREGRVFSSVDALAAPAELTFTAGDESSYVRMGEAIEAGGSIRFHVETNAPADAQIVLLKDGRPAVRSSGPSLRHLEDGGAGVYRVEVHLPGGAGESPVPWIVSNAIYVREPGQPPAAGGPARAATEIFSVFADENSVNATVESSQRSRGAIDVVPTVGGTQLSLRYALGGARSDSPYVAMVLPAGEAIAGYDRVMFTARAAAPMRLSVQLRGVDGGSVGRWHRSVYLDETPRDVTIFFDDMTPRGPARRASPVMAGIRDLLFVIDTVNARPNATGELRIDDVRYGR